MNTLTASIIAEGFQLAGSAILDSIVIFASLVLMATCFVVQLLMPEEVVWVVTVSMLAEYEVSDTLVPPQKNFYKERSKLAVWQCKATDNRYGNLD